MQLAGDIPFSIRLGDRGELKITATIHGPTGKMEAEVKDNEFQVNNPRWDRNWDHTGFEIVDEKQIPIFRVDRPRKNALRLGVYFAPLGGTEFSSRDDSVIINPSADNPKAVPPQPLFLYRSISNFGKRAPKSRSR